MSKILAITDYLLYKKRRQLISDLEDSGVYFDEDIQEGLVYQEAQITNIVVNLKGYNEDEYYKEVQEEHVPSVFKRALWYIFRTSIKE